MSYFVNTPGDRVGSFACLAGGRRRRIPKRPYVLEYGGCLRTSSPTLLYRSEELGKGDHR